MIQLEPFNNDDIDTLVSWVDNEETLVQFAGRYFTFPLTHAQIEAYIKDENRYIYNVVHRQTRIAIGHAEIFIQGEGVALLCRIIIGKPENRGQGFGQQIVKQLLSVCFLELAIETVELNVFDWNIEAIKCYEKTGFTLNGNKFYNREINGKTWKAVNMKIEKAHWERLQMNTAFV